MVGCANFNNLHTFFSLFNSFYTSIVRGKDFFSYFCKANNE